MNTDAKLEVVGRVAAADVSFLETEVLDHDGLKAVNEWCLAQEPPILDTEVVTQDEFTHDLIVTVGLELFLVYDST